jgi:predicted DNA binding CopG/RHH family protein
MAEKQFKYTDEDEREIIEEFENTPEDRLKPASPDVREKLERAAQSYRQDRQTKMNIRISPDELQRIKEQASREGLKYQSFVKSVLHKYITGQLIDSDKPAG